MMGKVRMIFDAGELKALKAKMHNPNFLLFKVILHQFLVKKISPENSIWNTAVPLLSYSCMLQVEICSQTTRNLQIRVHVYRPRHYCGD
jgi:hypothetical protein